MNDRLEPLPLTTASPVEPAQTDRAPAILTLPVLEAIHIATVTMAIFLATLAPIIHRGTEALAIALCIALSSLVALVIARAIRKHLSDLYRQFHYREKFALFLIHVGLLFVLSVLGVRDAAVLWGIFMVFLSLQGVNPLFFGRILFVGAMLVFLACLYDPLPPGWLLGAWLAAFLLATRFGHLRWRVQTNEDCRGVGLEGFWKRTLLPALLPPALGMIAWEIVVHSGLQQRHIAFGGIEADARTPTTLPTPFSIWEAAFAIAAIIASLVVLWWLDKKLRSRRKGEMMDETIGTATARTLAPAGDVGPPPPIDTTAGPRQQVIETFHALSRDLSRLGMARGDSESSRQWWRRLLVHLEKQDDAVPGIFDRACYSREDITADQAAAFKQAAEKSREEIIRHMEAQQASEREM
ncbi:MAG: DUF4129 domain-containing protein [Candidatus Sumerlaeia bacterium]|nr:DUF4129 domain-containing protein [Candidatus Sumerlaeia bacterium]